MLTVIKRSGNREPFDIDKIVNTVANASDSIREPMGSGEAKRIADYVYRELSAKESVSSRDVYDAVVGTLRSQGFRSVADAYVNASGNFWNSTEAS